MRLAVRGVLGSLLVLGSLGLTGCGGTTATMSFQTRQPLPAAAGSTVSPPLTGAEPMPLSLDPAADGRPLGTVKAPSPGGAPEEPFLGPPEGNMPPPAVVLPAPAESAAYIQELVQRFGLIDIRGSLATVEELRGLEAAFAPLPRECFRNLRISIEKRSDPSSGESGNWLPIDARGDDIDLGMENPPPMAGGHIRFYGPAVSEWTYVHEVAHHVTLFTDARFGQDLAMSLGYYMGTTTTRSDDREIINTARWDGRRVSANSLPTLYAGQDAVEHIAELIAFYFAADDPTNTEPFTPNFRMPARTMSLIMTKFGAVPQV